MNPTHAFLADTLLDNNILHNELLCINPGRCSIGIRSNSPKLLQHLRAYFSHVVCDAQATELHVTLIEREVVSLDIDWIDWKREPGKTGRKDSYVDLPDVRLIRKVRTGMVFLQSQQQCIAAGPCIEYDNQVINFINSQYMNWLQQRDWLICHAAALVKEHHTLAIAGFSGGGKSTLMLNMLGDPQFNFMTNDRLFITANNEHVYAAGIPKMPRINPGTIINNARLHSLIPAKEHARLQALEKQELWHLEEKHDVMIDDVYGHNRITSEAPLSALLILNWHNDSDEQLALNSIDLKQRQELLHAIMKSPGPFYQDTNGAFFRDDATLDNQAYLKILHNIPIYEATGKTDFESLAKKISGIMEYQHA